MASPSRTRFCTRVKRVVAFTLSFVFAGSAVGATAAAGAAANEAPPKPPLQASTTCRDCHKAQFEAWHATDHALANREANTDDAPWKTFPDSAALPQVQQILGHKPLWQPLVAAGHGRLQAHDEAFDPARQEWFNVNGTSRREPGDWGHWTGRGMNWNSQCAQCHMTGFERRYDLASDSYDSKWVEHGVGCTQCHGPMPDKHGQDGRTAYGPKGRVLMETCLTCHSRRQVLTEDFRPGDAFDDHYRLALPDEAALFHPDGQQWDEVFNGTSLRLSRMGHAGVTCMDCHDPHSTRLILPKEGNAICLQCHAPPGRTLSGGAHAPPISPVEHSHHPEQSAGNSCVGCHMPTTPYMQRAPRHDHGWTTPDPLLTVEAGIPNACSRCHDSLTPEALAATASRWYGEKLDNPQRRRARAIVQAVRDGNGDGLRSVFETEPVPGWRAAYLRLLARVPSSKPLAAAAVQASLTSTDVLERTAALRYTLALEANPAELPRLLEDPSLQVRLDAAWAATPLLAPKAPAMTELLRHLAIDLDQPHGRLRLAKFYANYRRFDRALPLLETAQLWDPASGEIQQARAVIEDYLKRQ
ncbi:cytochrome c3 family protein [Nibricoccus sp. IMCC34717]|uniref:cytochrome c3 family protein n=1 Tax=Nibricoccus sp. IMCC34717 TaxID=3034021 RepID=UPI00384C5752